MTPGIFYNSDGIWITTNAVWNDATYKWLPGDSGENVHAIHVTADGIFFYHKSQDTAGFATGWTLTNWDAYHLLGRTDGTLASGDFYNGITSYGDVYEEVQFREGFRQTFASTSESIGTILYCGENFRTRWNTAPGTYAITVDDENNLAAVAGVLVVAVNQWGLHFNVDFDTYTSDAGTDNYAEGYFSCSP
jgi:hypothetical protein